jgi:hypothetical protein
MRWLDEFFLRNWSEFFASTEAKGGSVSLPRSISLQRFASMKRNASVRILGFQSLALNKKNLKSILRVAAMLMIISIQLTRYNTIR